MIRLPLRAFPHAMRPDAATTKYHSKQLSCYSPQRAYYKNTMTSADCIHYTRPCMFRDCGRDAAYVLYEYLGNYCWSTDEEKLLYACPAHVEQLAAIHRITAADIHEYNDRVPF
jgi:hypothetical protein